MDKLQNEYAFHTLEASGLAVGLPAGVMGNSEVGHTTIGSGRALYQVSSFINEKVDVRQYKKHLTFIITQHSYENCKPYILNWRLTVSVLNYKRTCIYLMNCFYDVLTNNRGESDYFIYVFADNITYCFQIIINNEEYDLPV